MPARAQSPHEIFIPTAFSARSAARGLAAMAVRNIADVMQVPVETTIIR